MTTSPHSVLQWKSWMFAVAAVVTAPGNLANEPAELLVEVCSRTPVPNAEGLKPTQNSTLLDQSQRAPGGGGLCSAVAYEVTKPLTVYRLSGRHPDKAADYYNWWSFDDPSGKAEKYRSDNVMCADWGVEMKTTCKLRVGTQIAVGFGQSYEHCMGGSTIGPSETLQIFLMGSGESIQSQVEDCTTADGLLDP